MPVWINSTSGPWTVSGNWLGGAPNAIGAIADFGHLFGGSVWVRTKVVRSGGD